MALRKAAGIFKMIQYPWLTNVGIFWVKFLVKIHFPGVKYIVKNTLFEHFCGGETRKECLDTIAQISKYKVKSILDYSVEGKENKEVFDATCNEILDIIEFSKDKPEIPFSVFKPSAFGRIDLYEKVGKKEELTPSEQQEWNEVVERFEKVGKKAFESKATIMVDAEESWMQDAADELVENLMHKYNQEKCVICNTLQMYRKGRLAYLQAQYEKAKNGGYLLGFKVVRGAYMEKERERAEEMGYPSPIQDNKADTDKDFDAAISFILERIDVISLFAGTHNERSCHQMIQQMQNKNLEASLHKIWLGQLYGMSDNLSFTLAHHGYNVAKYLPYGPVREVIPYLTRRAQENTSIQGQSSRELVLLQKELKRRKTHAQ